MVFLDYLDFGDSYLFLDDFHFGVGPQISNLVMNEIEVLFVEFHCLVYLLHRVVG